MIITCDKCNTRFTLDDALVKATGTKVRCKQCEHVFDVYPSGKPASKGSGDAEISGLEMENKSLSAFSAEKAAGESSESRSGGIDFEFEFEESDEDSKEADEGLELRDEDLDFELEMESEGRTADKRPDPELELSDEDLKLELESSDRESEDVLTAKADDEEEFELDLDLEPVEFKGAESEEAFAEEEIDISEIEKILEMEEKSAEFEIDDEETELDLELDLEDEETAESASSHEENLSEEGGFDINLALEGEPETDFAPTEPVDSKSRPVQFPKKKDAETEPEEPLTMVGKDRKAQVQPFDIGTLAEPEEGEEEEEEPAFSIGSYEPQKPRGSRSLVYLLVILILAGAGYGAFWMMQNKGIKIPFISNLFNLSSADVTGNLNISTTEVASRFVTTAKQGRLFVITGKARNDYPEARSAIHITAKLYAPGKVLVATQSVFCGNFLSDLELESLDIETIQKILQNRSGDNYSGERIDPGKEIPFMVVFSSLPDNLEEFTIEVEGSSPVKS